MSECQLEPRPFSPKWEGSTIAVLVLLEHQASLVKQKAHHPSPPDLDPGPSSPSVNGREIQYEEGQVGKETITLTLDPRKFSGQ